MNQRLTGGSEYTGARLDVLYDHEYGHVHIGIKEAQEHLVDDVRGGLEAGSTNIASMAAALRDFNASVAHSDEQAVVELAQSIIDARDGLAAGELAQLQYNPEFKELVEACKDHVQAFIESYHWDLWIIEFSTLDEAARDKLNELQALLAGFAWKPPI